MYTCLNCQSTDIARLDERIHEYEHPESGEVFETVEVTLLCRECSHEWTAEEGSEEDYWNPYAYTNHV